jgi:hypothetical protein
MDLLALIDHAEGLHRSRGLDNAISKLLERLDGECSHALIILDHENHFAVEPSMDAGKAPRLLGDIRLAIEPRQIDLDGCTDADLGVNLYVPARLANEPVDLTEAEAGSFANALGRRRDRMLWP